MVVTKQAEDQQPNSTAERHYLRDVGDIPRLLVGWVIVVLALVFCLPAVVIPVVILHRGLHGDWKDAGFAALFALVCGLVFAAPLFWLARRLLRRSCPTNGTMIMPLWIFQAFGVVLIGYACLSAYQFLFRPKLNIAVPFRWASIGDAFVIGTVFLLVPRWVKRRARPPLDADADVFDYCRMCGRPISSMGTSVTSAICRDCQKASNSSDEAGVACEA